jgi:IS5 family transposase
MVGKAAESTDPKTIMIDATYLKAHRTACSLHAKRGARSPDRSKGGMNTKLHAVTDAKGRPIRFFMSAGQVSDHTGAAALLDSLPQADWFLADRGYVADWLRKTLQDRGIKACIPGKTSRKKAVEIRQAPHQTA